MSMQCRRRYAQWNLRTAAVNKEYIAYCGAMEYECTIAQHIVTSNAMSSMRTFFVMVFVRFLVDDMFSYINREKHHISWKCNFAEARVHLPFAA